MKEVICDIDLLLIMSVNPGWGGQKYIKGSEKKIKEAVELISSSGSAAVVEVDGGINIETAKLSYSSGASVLVAGSFIYGSKGHYSERIASLRT